VFDGRSDRPYTEADRTGPLSVYGASKLAGEALVLRAHDGAWIVRTAALFGLAGRHRGNFVETVLRAGGRGDPMRMVRDVVVSPTATADLAPGLLGMIQGDPEPGVYHMVNRGEASWYAFARAIVEAAGLDVEIEPVAASEFPSAVRRPSYSVLDGSKAAAVAGAMPHWRQGLEGYMAARAALPEAGAE
jgi:dTDP-4-dehydrorhamnose reductase